MKRSRKEETADETQAKIGVDFKRGAQGYTYTVYIRRF
jgi:hypothetical protein